MQHVQYSLDSLLVKKIHPPKSLGLGFISKDSREPPRNSASVLI